MMIAGNAARAHGISFSDPAQMASDLRLVAGDDPGRDPATDDQRGGSRNHGYLAFERLGVWRSERLVT